MSTRFYLRSEGHDRTVLYGPGEDPDDPRLQHFGVFYGPRPSYREVEEALARRGYNVSITAIEPRTDRDGWEVFYTSQPVKAGSRATGQSGGKPRLWTRWWLGRPTWLNWLTVMAGAAIAILVVIILARHPEPVTAMRDTRAYHPTPDQLNELLAQIAAILAGIAAILNAVVPFFTRQTKP